MEMTDAHLKLIDDHIKFLKESKNKDEAYKWEAIDHFQSHWNIDAKDFSAMFHVAFQKRANLFYQNSWGFISKLVKHFPEKAREMFRELYNEKIGVDIRLKNFQEQGRIIVPEVMKATGKGKLKHQQDERTMSVYLAFMYPDRHFIFKDSFYQTICALYQEKSRPAGEKYQHFCELAEKFKAKHVIPGSPVMDLYRTIQEKPSWEDTNLIVQNILYVSGYINSETHKYILVNITWNSKDWTTPTSEKSTHRYVAEGGVPAESWNFDFDNPRNTQDIIYGFSQFTNRPKVSGNNNLIIFSSQKQIVGFYGQAEVLDRVYDENLGAEHNYNLAGRKELSLCLENKITNLKEKGYLEDNKRIGQIGFSYLKSQNTILNMLAEAIELNPNQAHKLNSLKNWVMGDHPPRGNPPFPKNHPMNLIMFGPPGTGKTYHTVGEAMKAVAPDIYAQYAEVDHRDRLREEFSRLLIKDWDDPKGQIAFCTFHQSFSYEDFVEGIKPETGKDGNITYIIQDGIFKRICDLAESNFSTIKMIKEGILSWSKNDFKNATFYKISLGDVTKPNDREIYEYCKDNNCITIGSTVNMDYSGYSESKIYEKCEEQGLTKVEALQLNYFIHSLKTGHYVLVSHGNKYLRAIGRITGKYEYNENPPIRYNHFRSVEWLFVDKKIPVNEVYDRPFTQNTLYKINEKGLQEDFFTGKGQKESVEQKEDKRYVLIIDEINRGNIANIFGELITLIEKDKRAGQSEELEVVLPYSKTKFKVPPNLYIIGTMNTADRSIEALDTALRRRFSFIEMPPDPDLIKTTGLLKPTGIIKTEGDKQEINVVLLLRKINERIEKLIDKDHMIGHSYFMNITSLDDLKIAFKDKVIPLLEEYFFGDFGKIGLVLGNSFVERVNHTSFDFASFDGYNHDGGIVQDLADRPVYRIKSPEEPVAWNFVDVYSIKSGQNE